MSTAVEPLTYHTKLSPLKSGSIEPLVTFAPTKPMDVQPSLIALRGQVSIVSIYPAALHRRIRHNGLTDYHILAAPRGSYSKLVVYDTQEWMNRVSESTGKPEWLPAPIPALLVAQSLVQAWARNTLGNKSGFAPGVGIIAGDIPTQEELSSLREGQTNLFQWYILDGSAKHHRGEHTEITDIHRLAAREMLDKGAERLPWFPKIDFAEVKDCLACGKQIETRAKVCPDCSTNLVDWYLKYSLDPSTYPLPNGDPIIAAFIRQISPAKQAMETKEVNAKSKPSTV